MADGQVITTLFKFPLKISVFSGLGRIAVGDAAPVVGGTMLADMLETRAVALSIGGQFGKQGEAVLVAVAVLAEDDDGLIHASTFASS